MVNVGDVLYLYIEEFEKKKYFIILGEDNDNYIFASFYINSNKNYDFIDNPEIEKFHILLKQEEYPFLKYNSYLNLTKVFPRNKEILVKECRNNPDCLVYKLSDEQLFFLRKAFREIPQIKGKILKKYNFFEN